MHFCFHDVLSPRTIKLWKLLSGLLLYNRGYSINQRSILSLRRKFPLNRVIPRIVIFVILQPAQSSPLFCFEILEALPSRLPHPRQEEPTENNLRWREGSLRLRFYLLLTQTLSGIRTLGKGSIIFFLAKIGVRKKLLAPAKRR